MHSPQHLCRPRFGTRGPSFLFRRDPVFLTSLDCSLDSGGLSCCGLWIPYHSSEGSLFCFTQQLLWLDPGCKLHVAFGNSRLSSVI